MSQLVHPSDRSWFARHTGKARNYFALLKPRVMALAIFSAFVAMLIAPGAKAAAPALISMLAIAAGAGAAGAINMWYEADIDAKMPRTSRRPVPVGQVAAGDALLFGIVLAILSVVALAFSANPLSAGLLLATILFYGVIYTIWLKRRTPQNIVIGGIAGALPPVIGWTVATGSLDWQAGVLFAIIFLWTPPHFWSLAVLKTREYAVAGIPMMPNVAGELVTRRYIFGYAVPLAIAGVAPWPLGMAGAGYGFIATLLGLEFLRRSWAVLRISVEVSRKPARRLFWFSIFYLYLIFLALLGDALIAQLLPVPAV